MEGNQQQVKKHKEKLINTMNTVMEEMETELTFASFTRTIDTQIADSHRYERLKEEERNLTQDIQETTARYKKL